MQLFIRDREFYRKVIRIALPITAQGLIMISINLTDTVMLGVFGESQLSASSLANQFYSIFQICCFGLGGGAAVLTNQFWGSGNLPALKKTMTLMYRLCIILGLFFTLTTAFFPGQIMSIYSSDPALIENGIRYFSFLCWSFLFQGLTVTSTIILRSCHVVHIPLISSSVAFVLHIFGNWVFMFGNLGMPRMEIAGAGLSTLITRILEFIFIFGYVIFVDKKIGYKIRDLFRKCGDVIRNYFRYSFPVLISDLLLALGNNALAVVMGRIGSSFVSANAIAMVVLQFSIMFVQGVSNAGSVTTGNTLGTGDKDKAYHQGVTFLGISVMVGLIGVILILLINPLVIGFYNITDETKAITKQLMYALAFLVIFQSVESTMTKGVLRGGGDTRFLMVADILFLWVASVPLGILAAFVFHLPPFFIYLALKIDSIIKALWCIHRLHSKRWIRVVDFNHTGTGASETADA